MGNEDRAVDILVDKILYAINKRVEHLKFDKTFRTAILGKNPNGSYKISYENGERVVRNGLPVDELKVGQMVWVTIPCGSFREMYISGIARSM